MKRNYLKPEGALVSLSVNENISASGGLTLDLFFGVNYTIENADDPANRKVYIADSNRLSSDQTITDNVYSNLTDWLTAFFYPDADNCMYEPGV